LIKFGHTKVSSSPLRCSVSCVTFCLSDTRWSTGKVATVNESGLTRITGHILNIELILFLGHYFYMESEERKTKGLIKGRFSSIIFLLRLAGIPFKMKKISNIYAIYMITVIFCTSTTFIGMFADVYVRRNDLGRAMTNIRMLIPMVNNMWIFLYGR
jgi:hypothetical protein